jgi:choline dehydrogenase-like flavoprotein
MIESTKEGAMADYDAVIIGTGFGGSIAAQQLTER